MKPSTKGKFILLIDHQAHAREIATSALRLAGFVVCILDTYNYVTLQDCFQAMHPDLVVLSCTHIGSQEQQLITHVLADKYHLLILCVSLPWQVMHSLFLQGVDDVVDKPYEAASLVKIVNQTIDSTVPHNSYQAVERYGVA